VLSLRTGTVLKSIVRQYIIKAVPVPSQSLMEDYELGVSSATIRNEMVRLEREGYITRRHSSAGSIPCDKGYRYYVESLTSLELPLAEQRQISHLFHQVEKELEQWLCLAATLIARLVQNVAVVTMPRPGNCRFKHVEVLALQDSLALIVLVLRGAKVKQQLITLDRVVSQAELTAITGRLNITCAGLTNSQVVANATEFSPIERQLTDCLLKMMQTEDKQEFDEPHLDGLHFMLNQPEFAHSQRLLTLMELIEHRNLLRAIIPPELPQQGVQVVIGKENRTEVIQDYSVVISRYGLSEEAIGTIGIVGPTRMPYARAISTVGYLSSLLSELVAELYGREKPTG